MKKLMLCVFTILTMFKGATAQVQQHVKLSDATPSVNEKITITYDRRGTPLANKNNFVAEAYFIDNNNYPVADLDFKPVNNALQASFTIPQNTKAFFIRLGNEADYDNNGGKGYIYPVYKLNKVVPGAYAAMARIIGKMSATANIKIDFKRARINYEQEYKTYPDSKAELEGYISTLLVFNDTARALSNIKKLEATGDKERLERAVNFYRSLGKNASADSLNALIGKKFANIQAKRKDIGDTFVKESDPLKKESLYKQYVAQYPEQSKDSAEYDKLRAQVGSAYLSAGQMKDYDRVAATVKDKTLLSQGLNLVAMIKMMKGGNLDEIAALAKQSVEIYQHKVDYPGTVPFRSTKSLREEYQEAYDVFADNYVSVLLKQGKFEDAVRFEKPVYERNGGKKVAITEKYAQGLFNTGKYQDALLVAETAVKAYNYNPVLKDILKASYAKIKGSDADFDGYFETLKHGASLQTRTKVAAEMINLPGPQFSLKDLDGNLVTLADLKGKVVILDFWATWCGPCKASFPGMQLAVNRFKDDPNVKFLFIDVFESDDNYVENVRKYMEENKFTFHVLFDDKNAQRGTSAKLTDQLAIKGIPTKFILDKSGNVRFRTTGNAGTPEALAEEVSAMIDLAAHAETTSPAGKVQN